MKLTLLFKVFSQKHHEVKRSYKEQPLDAKNTSCDKMINYFSEIAEADSLMSCPWQQINQKMKIYLPNGNA